MGSKLPERIDVHSHFLPPSYSEALVQNGHEKPDGMPAIPPWSQQAHIEMMAAANVSKSILSISSPGVNLAVGNQTLARVLARDCNAYAAALKRKMPDKFGFWASLPLPDVEASLNEIDTALAEGADGFGLMTNYHADYVGSPVFDRVFDRLNELQATVFIHPTKPCMHFGSNGTAVSANPLEAQYPIPLFEFFFDTARAVVNLFLTGTVARCPNIKFIIPHAGGCLPPLISRFISFSTVVPGGRLMNDDEVREALAKQFYFDLAGLVFAGEEGGMGQLKALVEGFGISHNHLLYGSDFPFTPTKFVVQFAERMRTGLEGLFDETQREAIYRRNVVQLLRGAHANHNL